MLNYIKKNKKNATAIIVVLLVFFIGLIMTINSVGDTYAVSDDDYGCYVCSTDDDLHFWIKSDVLSELEDDSRYPCSGSWISKDLDKESCLPSRTLYVNFDTVNTTQQCTTIAGESSCEIDMPRCPTRDGYIFMGWFTKDLDDNKCDQNYMFLAEPSMYYKFGNFTIGKFDKSLNLYACWNNSNGCSSRKLKTLTFDTNGGSGGPLPYTVCGDGLGVEVQMDVLMGSDINVPTKDGYSFLGWSEDKNSTSPQYRIEDSFYFDKNTTLYAIWGTDAACYYNVSNGNCYWGNYADADNHYFVNYPYYECKQNSKVYKIEFDANGGSGAPGVQYKGRNVELKISTIVPTRNGYTFLHWNTKKDGTGTKSVSPGDIVKNENGSVILYAIWKANDGNDNTETPSTYSVTFKPNGGTWSDGSTKEKIKSGLSGTVTFSSLGVSSSYISRSGYTFGGWKTSSGEVYTQNVDAGDAGKTLTAVWISNSSGGGTGTGGNTETTTYTVTYDANGGSGAPKSQSGSSGSSITISSTKPTKVGYTFSEWNTKKDGTGTKIGSTYTISSNVTLYAQYKANEYKISYTLNGGTVTGNSSSATYDKEVTIKAPTKTVSVVGNINNTGATVGKVSPVAQKFAGWTSSTINTSTAYYGSNKWSNGSTKVTDTKFKNLTVTNGGTVTMVANWIPVDITLPTVTKEGYTCSWNTKSDGSGDSYKSGAKYMPSANSSSSINMYAICESNTKTDEEITENKKTGDVLIVIAWLIGIGSLGYGVYYLRSRKIDV